MITKEDLKELKELENKISTLEDKILPIREKFNLRFSYIMKTLEKNLGGKFSWCDYRNEGDIKASDLSEEEFTVIGEYYFDNLSVIDGEIFDFCESFPTKFFFEDFEEELEEGVSKWKEMEGIE